MKKLICPCCGRELIDLLPETEDEKKASFWCDNCSIDIDIWPDPETPVSISDALVRIDWYNAGEGISGDYNPKDPEDVNLLRFDVYYNPYYSPDTDYDSVDWEEVDDASYCTCVPADSDMTVLVRLLYIIFKRYRGVMESYPESSVKKLGESLSWINPKDAL